MSKMVAKGVFIFKSSVHKDGGTFTNQMGQEVSYKDSMQVKFDEVGENGEFFERKIKVSSDQTELIAKLSQLKALTKCVFTFEVGFNNSGTTLKLLDVEEYTGKQ